MTETSRPPLPPFTEITAAQKVRAAENAWNTHNPEKIALAYTVDSQWRNRVEFLAGREEIVQFLQRKWVKEQRVSPYKGAVGFSWRAYCRALRL